MASTNEDDRTDTDNSERDDERDENAEGKDEAQSDEQDGEQAASTDSEDAAKEQPAAKSKPATKPAAGSPGAKSSGTGKKPAAAGAKRPAGAAGVKGARKPVAPARPRTSGAMVKTLILFVIILGGLGAALYLLNPGDGGPAAAPKWNTGQTVDVEITLVSTDSKDLACASTEEIAGRKCEFETQTKPRPKAEGDDADKKLLKPYTTTDRVQFLAAGIWSEPALKGKLPTSRFSVKCKYTVEGKVKKPGVRWSTDWYDPGGDWYAGVVSGCSVVALP
jgi:hypothetical protein